MAFPVNPANGALYREGQEQFIADAGRWVRAAPQQYTAAATSADAAAYTPMTFGRRINASFAFMASWQNKNSVNDAYWWVSDSSNAGLNLDGNHVVTKTMTANFGSGASTFADMYAEFSKTGTPGIPMNAIRTNYHLKASTPTMLEVKGQRLSATEFIIESRMWMLSENSTPMLTSTICLLAHPITDIYGMGLNWETGALDINMHCRYW